MERCFYEFRAMNKKARMNFINIKKELYVGAVLDRSTARVTLMASSEGGMDIEEVAHHHPELIHQELDHPKPPMFLELQKVYSFCGRKLDV